MVLSNEKTICVAEADESFARLARIAEANGEVVIFEGDRPKYRLIDLDKAPEMELTADEAIDVAAARILKRYKSAFRELAK